MKTYREILDKHIHHASREDMERLTDVTDDFVEEMRKYKPEELVIDDGLASRMEAGREVGNLARGLFGGYVDVTSYPLIIGSGRLPGRFHRGCFQDCR